MTPLQMLGAQLPIMQAPMAGVRPPAWAAAVSNAEGLGSIGVGVADAGEGRRMIAGLDERSCGPFSSDSVGVAHLVSAFAREVG